MLLSIWLMLLVMESMEAAWPLNRAGVCPTAGELDPETGDGSPNRDMRSNQPECSPPKGRMGPKASFLRVCAGCRHKSLPCLGNFGSKTPGNPFKCLSPVITMI